MQCMIEVTIEITVLFFLNIFIPLLNTLMYIININAYIY